MLSEPVVKDASEDIAALITDLGVRGVWQSQSMVLFGICVVDTDSLSYLSCSPAVLCWLQLKLKRNESIVLLIVIVVLPSHLYVFLVDGLPGDEANSYLQHLACSLSVKWDYSFSEILN